MNTTKPTIYVEATALTRSRKTGVDYYAEGLMSELVRLMPNTQFVFFHFAETDAPLAVCGKNVQEVAITKLKGSLYRKLLYLSIAPSVESLLGLRNDEIERIIFPNFYAWPVKNKQASITPIIYDTAYIDTPEYVEAKNRALLSRLVARSLRQATDIVTISKATSTALTQHYGIPTARQVVVYPAVTLNAAKKSKLDLPDKYILFVGTLEPRKNVANIIRAYVSLPAAMRAAYKLVLAGGSGWLDEEIQDLLLTHAPDGIITLGYIHDADKRTVYERATIFVYPAIFEGFGMPVVEAQSVGLPVITSKNSSLPEAGGEAALYTKTDAASIGAAIQQLLASKPLRDKYASLGRKHAAEFTWAKSAQVLKKILESQV